MLPDRVSNPGSLTYESGALPIALRGPARNYVVSIIKPKSQSVNVTKFKTKRISKNLCPS